MILKDESEWPITPGDGTAEPRPWLPAQTALAVATLTERDTGTVVLETLVLPNLILTYHGVGDDWRFGEHMLCTPQYARIFVERVLPEKAAKFDWCECDFHSGHTLTVEVPDAVQ